MGDPVHILGNSIFFSEGDVRRYFCIHSPESESPQETQVKLMSMVVMVILVVVAVMMMVMVVVMNRAW